MGGVRMKSIAGAWAVGLMAAVRAHAADAAGVAFFEQKIRPVLVEHCYECHSEQAKKIKGGLRLDSRAGWVAGGDGGTAAIVPGKPEESLLIRVVQHLEDDLAMPPKQPKLSDAVIADLVSWVKLGAPDPRDGAAGEAKRADKSWWSLQPLRAADPAVAAGPAAVDHYVEAGLREKGLALNPPADARTLIRRMSYDVTGLPPTAAEVGAFTVAYRAEPERAVAELADRLLASPAYGERWGRHWLDVVRFGESNGFERNFLINDLWPFRDYVIRSLNDDKPFNRFIIEHLAGDVVGKHQPETEIGSAFLVAGPYDDVGNQDVVAQKAIRAATLDDLITATSGAFLGVTIACARCHHHKFDPIVTEDYYRLRAAFEGVTHGRRVIASKEERAAFKAAADPLNAQRAKLVAERDGLEREVMRRAKEAADEVTATRPKVNPELTEERFEAVAVKAVKLVMSASTANPKSATGSRIVEFEAWSAGEGARNVALGSQGAKAEGAKSAVAEDFPEAYGAHLAIDGRFGEQWFIGNPAVLTVTFATTETIERVSFRSAKDLMTEDKAQGATPTDYEVHVSADGETWQTVASSAGREPWSAAHAIERLRREVTTPDEAAQIATLSAEIAKLDRALKAVPALREVWAGKYAQPAGKTFVQKGGDPMKPGEAVVPGSPTMADRVVPSYALAADAPEGERRRALGEWIVRDDHPLTPRVLANRVWQYHFGTGIVDTPSDFGFLGGRPTHPELLDYLARRLVEGGWRLKPLHREILLSRTYRQSGAHRAEAAGIDQEARLLWRFPPRRLGAEELRDTMLHVAGKLDRTLGGPGFRLYKFTQNNVSTYFPLDRPGPETYRRSVYHQNARASVVDVLNDFDLPDIAFAAPRRANTTTPLQALTLLNHSFTTDMAQMLAARLGGGSGATSAQQSAQQVDQAYAIAFQRGPTTEERAAAGQLIATHGLAAFCRAVLNMNELIYLD